MAAAEDANSIQNPSGSEAPKLSDLLDRGWKLFEEVDTTNEPSNSNAVQVKVKRAIMQLEEATRMVNQLVLFRLEEHTHTQTLKRRMHMRRLLRSCQRTASDALITRTLYFV